MRAAVLSQSRFSVEQVPDPTVEPGTVVLQVAACGICGTDHAIYQNRLLPDGAIIGHEFAGTVVAISSGLRGWEVGDRAAVLPLPFCGRCELCTGGQQNLCRHGLALEIGCGGASGGLAELVRAPVEALRRLPATLPPRYGALVDPVAVALHAVNLGAIAPGTSVGIIGLGPLGLFAGILARQNGALTFGLDARPARVEAAHRLGLGAFASDDRADESIRDLTRGGPDVVIEASGRPESIERAAQLARVGGRVVMVSSYHAPAEIRPGHWLNRGISLLPSIAYTGEEFDAALEMIVLRRIDVGPLITSVFGLGRVQSAFDRFETQNDAIKLLVDPSLADGDEEGAWTAEPSNGVEAAPGGNGRA